MLLLYVVFAISLSKHYLQLTFLREKKNIVTSAIWTGRVAAE